MAEKIDAKYLRGLKYRSSEGAPVEKDGRKVMEYRQTERALKPEDVLDWRDKGDAVIIVTGDGQKVTITKEK